MGLKLPGCLKRGPPYPHFPPEKGFKVAESTHSVVSVTNQVSDEPVSSIIRSGCPPIEMSAWNLPMAGMGGGYNETLWFATGYCSRVAPGSSAAPTTSREVEEAESKNKDFPDEFHHIFCQAIRKQSNIRHSLLLCCSPHLDSMFLYLFIARLSLVLYS